MILRLAKGEGRLWAPKDTWELVLFPHGAGLCGKGMGIIMKILIAMTSSEKTGRVAKRLKEKLEDSDENITVALWNRTQPQITCADVRKAQADLFITFNLAGFEGSTLTDGVAFNLLDCKQIHFLLDTKMENERYLDRLLSISMFFYCGQETQLCSLQERYPDLPYLKALDGWERTEGGNGTEKNAETLFHAVREVMGLCHMV